MLEKEIENPFTIYFDYIADSMLYHINGGRIKSLKKYYGNDISLEFVVEKTLTNGDRCCTLKFYKNNSIVRSIKVGEFGWTEGELKEIYDYSKRESQFE